MNKQGEIVVAAVGLDHRHIYGMLDGLLQIGARCKGWWTEGEPQPLAGFLRRFPDLPRVDDRRRLLEDPEIDLFLIAAVPSDRADLAIEAMEHGKDVMLDKPGCTTLEQLDRIRAAVRQTGRIWSIDFSERFEVPAVTKAAELMAAGAIGKFVQTVATGPHRLNRALRAPWFFKRECYGGILADIGSHQIDQFLYFSGAKSAEIVYSAVGNFANPGDPGLDDFGEMILRNENGQGYIRLDWYTPDALPTWGDVRLFITGTEGYMELRKYVDIAGREGGDHLFLVNGTRCEHIDCSGVDLPYFPNLLNDVRNRTQTSMPQEHVFTVTELALKAQAQAAKLGNAR